MIEVQLDAASVGRICLRASPTLEVVSWLALAAHGQRHPLLGDPGAAARFALRSPVVAAVASLLLESESRGYVPDFMVPKPSGGRRPETVTDQLERIRATPVERAHRESTAGSGPSVGTRRRLVDGDLPQLVAAGLAEFWSTALADEWPDILRVAEDQVRVSGEGIAAHGMGAMIDRLHPALSWTGSALRVDKKQSRTFAYADAELVIVPSVLSPPRVTVQLDDPDDAYVAYPVRGERRRAAPSSATPAKLLGGGRSRVLLTLSTPATTREVSRRVGLSEPTVSHHLHALADAGLVQGRRHGRNVRYALTGTGEDLLKAMRPTG